MKKTIVILTILVNTLISAIPAQAQTNTGKEAICQRDFATFISATISYDGFSEYWKDIFVRYNKNFCYYMDVDSVLKQLEQTRTQIRAAFYSCSTERANHLKDRYYELEAELFFLRNYVDISQSEIKAISEKKVFEELKNNFVINKSYFTEEKVKELFDKFKKKYGNRVNKTYAECKDIGLDALIKKWKSLKENIKAMGTTGKNIKDKWNKSLNTPSKRTGAFLGGFVDFRLNNLPIKKGADQIFKELKKQLPTGTNPNVMDVQSSIVINNEQFANKVEKTTITAEYEALFKHSGDEQAKDFENILKELNSIITATFKPLENLESCTKKVGARQCK